MKKPSSDESDNNQEEKANSDGKRIQQQESLMTIEMRNGDESAERSHQAALRRKRKFRGLKQP